jgi:hypothetical protein
MIFDGDPSVDKLTPSARLFYPAGFKRDDIYGIHEAISDMLNVMGESGKSLVDAAALVVRTALENGAERAFENYVSRGAGIYAYDVVERRTKS